MSSKPLILAIDDDEREIRAKIPSGFTCEVVDPRKKEEFSDQISKFIDTASLILIDHKFWDQPAPLSLTAMDGASFVAHLRSWSRLNEKKLAPIVMFTNEAQAFANEIPAVGAAKPIGGTFVKREHRLAPTLDVEWIQFKAEDDATDHIADLANAYIDTQKAAGTDGASLDDIESLLKLPPEAIWTIRAREELQSARPPVNQTKGGGAELTRGPSQIVRWLCHRALPYPGLFLSDLYTAWALGISREALEKLSACDPTITQWASQLHACKYSGPLNRFLGQRWWRAGIDQTVWQLDEEARKAGSRQQAFKTLAPNIDLGELKSPASHVVIWTDDFREDAIVPTNKAVQLHPPGWPAEALEPWMLKAEVENDPVLKAMCDPSDLV